MPENAVVRFTLNSNMELITEPSADDYRQFEVITQDENDVLVGMAKAAEIIFRRSDVHEILPTFFSLLETVSLICRPFIIDGKQTDRLVKHFTPGARINLLYRSPISDEMRMGLLLDEEVYKDKFKAIEILMDIEGPESFVGVMCDSRQYSPDVVLYMELMMNKDL